MANNSSESGIFILIWAIIWVANWIWTNAKKKPEQNIPATGEEEPLPLTFEEIFGVLDGQENAVEQTTADEFKHSYLKSLNNPAIAKKQEQFNVIKPQEKTPKEKSKESASKLHKPQPISASKLRFSGNELQKAIIMSEIIAPPKAKRSISRN